MGGEQRPLVLRKYNYNSSVLVHFLYIINILRLRVVNINPPKSLFGWVVIV